jgi:hypothetical protein
MAFIWLANALCGLFTLPCGAEIFVRGGGFFSEIQ